MRNFNVNNQFNNERHNGGFWFCGSERDFGGLTHR